MVKIYNKERKILTMINKKGLKFQAFLYFYYNDFIQAS